MTTQHQIIAICIIVFIAVPLGTFTTIKCIKKLTRVPENTLIRSGDIELNYIEPVHHGHVYQPIDSVNPNYINYEAYNWVDRVPSYYTGQSAPSYFSGGNPPSYNVMDRVYINSILENENINLYFIWIIFICFLIIILKMNQYIICLYWFLSHSLILILEIHLNENLILMELNLKFHILTYKV